MRNLILCVFLLSYTLTNAQFLFEGKVMDENNNPLNDVHVHIGNETTSTNAAGFFSIKNIAKGTHKLYISYIGYETISESITIDKNRVYNKQLFPRVIQLESIVVNTVKNKYSAVTNEQQIDQKRIENYSNQTLGDVLKEVPGVRVLKTGSGIVKPIINGLHSFRVPVINNNTRLEDQQWGVEHAPNFDVNTAQSITVLKGAAALQYGGDAIGGIVLIEPISVKKDTLFGKTILNGASNGRGGSLSTGVTKGAKTGWAWNVLGTAKYLGDIEAPNYVLSNTGIREQNFSGNIRFSKSNYSLEGYYSVYNAQMGIARATHIGNTTDLYNAINNSEPNYISDFSYAINSPKQEVTHHTAKLSYFQNVGLNNKFELHYAFQNNNRKEFDIRRSSTDKRAALDLDLLSQNLGIHYKTILKDWTFLNGLNFGFQNNTANPNTGVRPLIPNFTKQDIGAFSIFKYTVNNSLVLEAGGRYDFSRIEADKFYLKSRWDERGYSNQFSVFIVEDFATQWLTNPTFKYSNFTGSMGFKKQFHHEIDMYFNIGLAARNPNVSELFSDGLHHSSGQIELGDLRLQQEKALKINGTIKKRWQRFNLELNPFVNRINDFIYLQPTGFETTIRGAFPVWEYKQTNAVLVGFDLSGNWQINEAFEYHGSISYVNGKNRNTDEYLIDMPPLNTNQSISYTNNSWKPIKLELQHETVFRQNKYPNFNFETNIVENGELVAALVDISTAPKAYSLVHFRAECEFSILKNQKITTAFFVQNALNTKYRDYLNRQRFYVDELGRNIQIQIKFNY